mmetsp:Transcript_1504/g.2992  ORF Transcript_1504/g.2992 Transcript_1504/m.2992 type:complete len:393 (-) Transcript_1504:55-1233(-)
MPSSTPTAAEVIHAFKTGRIADIFLLDGQSVERGEGRLKRRYLELARLFHPDKTGNDAESSTAFLCVKEAFEIFNAEGVFPTRKEAEGRVSSFSSSASASSSSVRTPTLSEKLDEVVGLDTLRDQIREWKANWKVGTARAERERLEREVETRRLARPSSSRGRAVGGQTLGVEGAQSRSSQGVTGRGMPMRSQVKGRLPQSVHHRGGGVVGGGGDRRKEAALGMSVQRKRGSEAASHSHSSTSMPTSAHTISSLSDQLASSSFLIPPPLTDGTTVLCPALRHLSPSKGPSPPLFFFWMGRGGRGVIQLRAIGKKGRDPDYGLPLTNVADARKVKYKPPPSLPGSAVVGAYVNGLALTTADGGETLTVVFDSVDMRNMCADVVRNALSAIIVH